MARTALKLVNEFDEMSNNEKEDFMENRQKNLDGDIDASQLEKYVQRLTQLEEDKNEISLEIKDIYSSLKGEGFDVKVVKELVSIKVKDTLEEKSEYFKLLEVYADALNIALF